MLSLRWQESLLRDWIFKIGGGTRAVFDCRRDRRACAIVTFRCIFSLDGHELILIGICLLVGFGEFHFVRDRI
jgi:hypothetical protein